MMYTERYECTTNGHDKFWSVHYPVDGNQTEKIWVVAWGKIGTTGQSKTFGPMSAGRAHGEARAKIREKLDKGYVLVSPPGAAMPTAPKPSLPIQKVKLTPKLQAYCGGHAPVLMDLVAQSREAACSHCNGTGKFKRAFGRIDTCRQCQGCGVRKDAEPVAEPIDPLPSPALRKFDWSDA